MNLETRRKRIIELIQGGLERLERLGQLCTPINCICNGQYERCPLREDDSMDSEDESDADMDHSPDEGYYI